MLQGGVGSHDSLMIVHVPAVRLFFLKEFLSSWLQKGQKVEWRLPELHSGVRRWQDILHTAQPTLGLQSWRMVRMFEP